MERALRRVGADIPRWRVLVLASERGSISVSAIAVLPVIRLSTATKVTQRMERDGLVSLRRSRYDARVTEVRITAQGSAITRHVRRTASTIFHQAFAGIAPREIRNLNELLERSFDNISDTVPRSSRAGRAKRPIWRQPEPGDVAPPIAM